MKKIIHFSKFFIPCVIMSLAIIGAAAIMMFTKGLNLGVDFKPGLIKEFKIAPTAISLTYKGSAQVSVQVTAQGVSLVVAGVGADNTTYEFPYLKYKNLEEMTAGFNTVEGVTATLKNIDGKESAQGLFTSSDKSSTLSDVPYNLHIADSKAVDITSDDIRAIFDDSSDIAVKALGVPLDNHFQIRVGDDGESSKEIRSDISAKLIEKFGSENYAIVKTDFIGSQYSGKLVFTSIITVLMSLVLIWLYATIRFKWDFALGAVLAILHDALIMVAFMVFTQMEFTSASIAAILTIIGYSINDTVVVLDRVRENMKLIKVNKFSTLLDISQTDLLGRTLITSFTTLLAVVSLFIFTTGSMKDFALALIIGLISGVYSTIFIAGAFIAAMRRKWQSSEDDKKTQIYSVE
ncbi:MAG: protein translocase subunit SecF [Treponema sp.]|nr:protein translocase subunit SecF [Treponema sp.]